MRHAGFRFTAAVVAVLVVTGCGKLAKVADVPYATTSATSLVFQATAGGTNPAAQTVTIGNSGGGTLAKPTATISYANQAGWLSATVSGAAAPYTITLQPNITGIAPGGSSARVSIASAGASKSPRTVDVTLTVTQPLPSNLVYSSNPAVYTVGTAITANTPSSSGGAVASYTVSPALPAGLNLNSSTGEISGTPAAIMATASYTVTATNSGGSTNVNVSITVNDVPPSNLLYSSNPAVYTAGTAIPANAPSTSGGAVATFTGSPALPAGLNLDGATGVISGTPDASASASAYTVTATNSGGSTNTSLTITVNWPSPLTIGVPTLLSSIKSNSDCWFPPPIHAVFTNASGSWIASAEHHYCDTQSDPLVVYNRPSSSGSWSATIPFSYDYTANPPSNNDWWDRGSGLDGPSSTASAAGDPQVFVPAKEGSGYWFPDHGVYIRRSGGAWQVTQNVNTDEDLQIGEGNAPGATYSWFRSSIVNDPATDTIHLFGYDGTWFATRYHAVYSSAPVGSSTWTALSAIYTATGAVDREAIQATSQDIRGAFGMQVWVDAPACALKGRELSGGSWGANSISLPLSGSGCTASSSNFWNLCGALSETVLSPAGVPTIVYTATPCGTPGPLQLILSTRNGSWSSIVKTMPSWGAAPVWRAFDDANGRLHIVHLDSTNNKLMAYDVAADQDSVIYQTNNTIQFVDAERHDPKLIVWAEADSSKVYLKVADLNPGTCSGPAPSGSWSAATGTMTADRAGHTATLLASGKVLIAGGAHNPGPGSTTALASAELYDPASGTFTATGSMTTKRDIHQAFRLADGRVLVLGGRDFQTPVAAAEIYNPGTGLWQSAGSLLEGRWGHTATLLQNGKVLVACGNTTSSQPVSAAVEIYDPATGTSTAAAPMGAARSWCMAALLPNGEVLVAGGHDASYSPMNATEIYNPSLNTWRAAAPMSEARNSSGAVVLPNGRFVVIGGGTPTVSAEVYDPTANTWSPYGSASHSGGVAASLKNGDLLYIGGGDAVGNFLTSVDRFVPCAAEWSPASPLSMGLQGMTGLTATVLDSGKVLVAGGDTGTFPTAFHSVNTGEIYSP